MQYKILEHRADLKIKAYGKDLAELFVNAALAMASQQAMSIDRQADEKSKGLKEPEEVIIESADLKSLLVDWLNEILYRSDVNAKVYFDFEIEELNESPAKLKAKISGRPFEQKKLDIKAATYHDLDIIKKDDYYEAIIIFDI